MRKASDFLSKPLISLNEGKNEGVIKNISFDAKLHAAEWLVLYDEDDCDCDEKAVRISEAYSVGENAVMIKSGQAVIPAVSAPLYDNNPINCRIFTALGKLVGVVSDVILTDENRTAGLVYDNDKTLPLSEVVSSSRDIVVKSENGIKAERVPEKKVPAPTSEDTKRKVKALSKEKSGPAAAAAALETPDGKEPEKKEKPAGGRSRTKQGKALSNKKTAAAPKKVKKNEPAGVTAETVETVKADAKITAEAVETPAAEVVKITAEIPKILKAEDIVIREPAEKNKQDVPRAENPYKIYDDISANFQDLRQPEVFVYGTGDAAEKTGAREPLEDGRSLGIAVPIKKKLSPGERRKEQLVKAFQLRHDPADETVSEPVTPLIFDNGGNIEIWPFELEHIPERIIAAYGFLLGRRVAKNIYNAAHQLVIKADTVVNVQIVETARKYGRLVDLTKLSTEY